jgi:hypothetical protein
MKKREIIRSFPVVLLIFVTMACSFMGYSVQREQVETPIPPTSMPTELPPSPEPPTATQEPPTAEPPTAAPPTATETPTVTPSPTIAHQVFPVENPALGGIVYDVVSEGTAPELRAPYGDSYQINRLERPFLQNMEYVPDLDIDTYRVTQDKTWVYVSIKLVGSNPNNEMGIHYAVEIDTNEDGFGEYILWGRPPYSPSWDTTPVQVYADRNHDTGGRSPMKSDAPMDGDGYETLVFDGGVGEDPDLAWVRVNAGLEATVQFAFKKTLAGNTFLLGVVSDAGEKDFTKLDYVDRYKEEEAGSPIRGNKNYPLKELFAVDNACRQAYGFIPSGFEPQLCPVDEPTPRPKATPSVCQPPPYCTGLYYLWDQALCTCFEIPF